MSETPFRDLRDTRKTLLGLSLLSFGTWRTELRPAVKAAQNYFETWARKNVSWNHEARNYLYFLRTSAAEPLRLDGLLLLQNHVKLDDDYFCEEDDLQDAFAQFLQFMIDHHWSVVASSQVHREAFMHFALKLTALQHALGSELLTLAANRLGGAER